VRSTMRFNSRFNIQDSKLRCPCSVNPRSDIPCTRARVSRLPSGFTLLELTVVIFLMGLALSISALFLARTTPSARLSAVGREISATIRQARSLAQVNGTMQAVLLNFDTRMYGIEGRGVRRIPPDIGIKVVDPLFGDIQTGTYRMLFDAAGGVEAATIDLWSNKRMMRIATDPIVGTVTLKQ
jgi:prepilin-type N-terminal cleavage/methylation domain-containing protein